MYRIMIDPSGGGVNHGLEYKGRMEKDDTIKFANALCYRLEDTRLAVTSLTRYDDMDMTMRERVEMTAFVQPDLLISIRRNNKDGLGYYATTNSIASNIIKILELKIKDKYKAIESVEYNSKMTEVGCPVLVLFINNIKTENEEFDTTYIELIDEFISVMQLISHNSPESVKNIINAMKNHDTVLQDDEGYFLVGPHPGYDENIIFRSKSLNQAIQVCDRHINVHVFRDNNPNAKSLHKSNMKRLAPSSYTAPLMKYQEAYITSKTGTRSFEEKSLRSRCITTYTYRRGIKILASKSDVDWVYVVDTENGNGYIPRKCVSI